MKKTTITETFDDDCKLITRETVIEEDTYTPFYIAWDKWPVYPEYPL